MAIDKDLAARATKIKLLLMDCDGVLTDGRLYFGESGEQLKAFHTRDGQGIVDWHKAGFHSGIISGRTSPIVDMRAAQLGIEFVWQGRTEKVSALNEILSASGILPEETAFIGDDTPDAEVMPHVGLAVAVADSLDSVKMFAQYVTKLDGGCGAVREVIELILLSKKSQ